jgi:hypothetical protein
LSRNDQSVQHPADPINPRLHLNEFCGGAKFQSLPYFNLNVNLTVRAECDVEMIQNTRRRLRRAPSPMLDGIEIAAPRNWEVRPYH